MIQVEGGMEDLDGAGLTQQPLAMRTLLPTLTRSFESVVRVAKTGLPILISGETGTGKEELARAIHELSDRKGPLQLAPCGALSVDRLEPLAAQARQGGTLFLDEISDLSEATQVALLALLDSLPATAAASPKRPDLLLVSSSHLKPADLLTAPRLRRDLHARLSGYVVSLPPLSERREDIGNLVSGILQASPDLAHDVRLTAGAGTALLTHDWPLNVRELKNALLSSVALTEDGVVHLAHLPVSVTSGLPQPSSQPQSVMPERSLRSDEERRLQAVLIANLVEHRGNVAAVSRALDKAPMQVHRWMKRFNIDPSGYRGPKKS
jgi:DNA-binding NtrC family response regulator